MPVFPSIPVLSGKVAISLAMTYPAWKVREWANYKANHPREAKAYNVIHGSKLKETLDSDLLRRLFKSSDEN